MHQRWLRSADAAHRRTLIVFTAILGELDAQADQTISVSALKKAHKDGMTLLAEAFDAGADVVDLVHARAHLVDALLQRVWHHFMADKPAALIAVGGYGRGELHPASDVDVLMLTEAAPETLADALEPLITLLWDIGLEIGHSVRSLDQCVEEATADITIATNLMESRLLAGQLSLFEHMLVRTSGDHIWPSERFFAAKLEEQQARHAKVDDSSNDLEPNIKNNPGGLRDMQMIGWVAKRHFGATRLSHLKAHGFLTEQEYQTLKDCEHFLWQIRFALHLITGRHEDRLLFEHQRTLAKRFGYDDANTNLAVEQFMQRYYLTAVTLQRLNEMLLQLFQEVILKHNDLGEPRAINRRFQARGDFIEVIDPAIFSHSPLAMLEIFLLLQQHPELKGVRASTIRAIRAHRHLINDELRASIQARSLFMEILRQPSGITHELRRMHRYGVLNRYLPAFAKITGLMQFDLFHLYTVDEHILMVVRNLRRFSLPEFADECPLCHQVKQTLPKPELAYIAGLFHDIAKGRGGDHSELGTEDAYQFCRDHMLSEYDSRLVSWLVRSHLVMSSTAQRKDIDDPEVIQSFAEFVGDIMHLDYLYLLTVADMRGTNPKRWNAWKGALMDRLYHMTRESLKRGLDTPSNQDQVIQETQTSARELLSGQYPDQVITECWMQLSTDYFLQTNAESVAWHTRLLLNPAASHQGIRVFLRDDAQRGCSEIFALGPDRDQLFADTAGVIDQMGINILGARIDITSSGLSFNSYFVLEADGGALQEHRRLELLHKLEQVLNREQPIELTPRRMPRELKSFARQSRISLDEVPGSDYTLLQVDTQDRPGLLSTIGAVLAQQKLRMHSARVVTEGAIARDQFMISDRNDQAITDAQTLSALQDALIEALDD